MLAPLPWTLSVARQPGGMLWKRSAVEQQVTVERGMCTHTPLTHRWAAEKGEDRGIHETGQDRLNENYLCTNHSSAVSILTILVI